MGIAVATTKFNGQLDWRRRRREDQRDLHTAVPVRTHRAEFCWKTTRTSCQQPRCQNWQYELVSAHTSHPPPFVAVSCSSLQCLHGWCSQLAWQWSPTLTGLWWLSHQFTLWYHAVCCFVFICLFCLLFVCLFERETWSLNPFCLLACILVTAFPECCFCKRVGTGLGTFSLLGLSSSVRWHTISIDSSPWRTA